MLDSAGCKARILTAPEIASSTAQVTRGVAGHEVTETWRSTPCLACPTSDLGSNPVSSPLRP
ncbi:type VII secretion protein EccE [Rhodococcus sp. 3Y1]